MLRNNIELELKTRFAEEGITQTEVAEKLGVSPPYVNRIIRGREQIVNKTFIKILDELGYDVELTYKKKAEELYGKNNKRKTGQGCKGYGAGSVSWRS